MPKGPDDLEGLKAEREAADREYNDALTRLDAAMPQLPAEFPHPPRGPDDHQVTSLNTLWKIDVPPAGGGIRGRFQAAVRRIVAPLFEQQHAFNSAVVDHLNRNLPAQRETQQAIDGTLRLLRDQLAALVRFQSLLIMFLQQITPYVDTRDRDVAGLLRGLSGAINGVADELMKRSEALLARDRRRDVQLDELQAKLAELQARVDELQLAPTQPRKQAQDASGGT